MSDHEGAFRRAAKLFSWERIADYIEAVSGVLAAGVCVCSLVSTLVVAARRPFWLDEIFTISIARTSTVSDVLAAFEGTLDQTPPLNAFLVRLFGSFFGWSELVARLPSAIFATVFSASEHSQAEFLLSPQ